MRVLAFAMAIAMLTLGAWAQLTMAVEDHPYVNQLCGGDASLMCISPDLLRARQAVLGGADPDAAAQEHCSGSIRGGELQVIISCSDVDKAAAAAEAAGLTVVHTFDDYGVRAVTARCSDPTQLDSLVASTDVNAVRGEPIAMTWAGSVAEQAGAAMGAPAARTNFTVDGTGVRVGVLSDSIVDLRLGGGSISAFPELLTGSTDQVLGDLPASIRIIDPGPGGGSDEGNGMGQLIFDSAPGCDISFASAFTSYFAFATNITALHTDATAPADVIVDDVFYFDEPAYQDGPIAIAADGAFAAGVPYFSSAGNNADNAHESAYLDINAGTDDGAVPPSGVDLHDFSGGGDTHLTFTAATGEVITVTLKWDEPYGATSGGGFFAAGPGAEANLDLYITSDTVTPITGGNTIASSAGVQGTSGLPAGDPTETVQYTSAGGTEHIVIDHVGGVDPSRVLVSIFFGFGGLGGTVTDTGLIGDRTIWGHTAAAGVESVAAIYHCDIDIGGGISPDFTAIDPEPFTSDGGLLPFDFDATGSPIAPITRFKPDIAAPDGGNTTFFGSPSPGLGGTCGEPDGIPNFFGTSAAAPMAAAGAALLIEQARKTVGAGGAGGTPTPTTVYGALEATSIDVVSVTQRAPAGVDVRTGVGRIDVNAAMGMVPVELSIFSDD